MKRLFNLILMFVVFAVALNFAQTTKKSAGYDPLRNPQKDLDSAIVKATSENKFILLEVGGEWCSWCHRLEEFFQNDNELKEALHNIFVVVKVNYSKENKNEEFLDKFPKVPGFPHIFILDRTGKLIKSQDTADFEEGKGYSKEKILQFINAYKNGCC